MNVCNVLLVRSFFDAIYFVLVSVIKESLSYLDSVSAITLRCDNQVAPIDRLAAGILTASPP